MSEPKVWGWFILFVCLGILLCGGYQRWRYQEYQNVPRRVRAKRLEEAPPSGTALMVIGVAALVATNLISYYASVNLPPIPTTKQVAVHFGLKSGHEYPLVLGSRIQGSSGQAEAYAGFFSASVSTSLEPASAITVSFTSRSRSYMLELPTSRVTYVQDANATPSIAINMKGGAVAGKTVTRDAKHPDFALSGGCEFQFKPMAICNYNTVPQTVVLSSSAEKRGLAALMADGFDSATITVTPAQYKAILGGE